MGRFAVFCPRWSTHRQCDWSVALLGNTSGSTSRTAESLVQRELLARVKSDHDARSVTFSLTNGGQDLLDDDPLHDVANILESVSPEDLARLSQTLEFVYAEIAKKRSS